MFRLKVQIQPGKIELDKKLLRATFRAAGNEVKQAARSLIIAGGMKTPKQRRPASKPGQAPMNQTGALAAGLIVRVFRNGEGVRITDTARSKGGSGAPYAIDLEAGARGGAASFRKGVKGRSNRRWKVSSGRIVLPRPFLSTALAMRASSLEPRVAAAVNGGLKFIKGPKP